MERSRREEGERGDPTKIGVVGLARGILDKNA